MLVYGTWGRETREGWGPRRWHYLMGRRAPLCRTHPDEHRAVLLGAQAISPLHPWKQARMWAALELTPLIPADSSRWTRVKTQYNYPVVG